MYTLYKLECLFEKSNTISLFVFSFFRSTWKEAGATRGRALLDEDQQVASSVVGMSSVCMQLGRDRARPSGWGYARRGTVLHGRRGRIPGGREGKRTRSRSWLQSGRRVCTASVFFDVSDKRVLAGTRSRPRIAGVWPSVLNCVLLDFCGGKEGDKTTRWESRVQVYSGRWNCAQPPKRRKDTGTKKRTIDDVVRALSREVSRSEILGKEK